MTRFCNQTCHEGNQERREGGRGGGGGYGGLKYEKYLCQLDSGIQNIDGTLIPTADMTKIK